MVNKLEQEFVAFVKSMDEHVEIHGDETDDLSYTTVTYKKGDYWYNGSPGFNDFNKDIDYKQKLFGIRSDDNFWIEAGFPYEFRFLDIDFICKTIWGDMEYITSPDFYRGKDSILRLKWEAERSACRFYENREDFRKWEVERGKDPVKLLLKYITTKWDRYALLEKLDKDDFWYKPVKNFKMHKRYGYVARSRRLRNRLKLVKLEGGGVTLMKRKRAKELGILDQWEAAGK